MEDEADPRSVRKISVGRTVEFEYTTGSVTTALPVVRRRPLKKNYSVDEVRTGLGERPTVQHLPHENPVISVLRNFLARYKIYLIVTIKD